VFALLLSFPLLCLQASGTDLPEALRAEPNTTAAWSTAQDSSVDAQLRQEASDLVVSRVVTLTPAEQLPFLLEAQGAGLLSTDLTAVFRHLDDSWDLLEDRLVENLSLPLPANQTLVHGTLIAAGQLASSHVGLLEGVSVFLNRQNYAADARQSLENLTGRQFADRDEFQVWWQSSSTLGREIWQETALREKKAEELADWRILLANGVSIDQILRGLQHSRQEINELALASLKLYDFAGATPEAKAKVSAAFRDALQNEKVLVQRRALLELVPRFLTGHEALNPLLRALKFGHPSEKQPAARLLKQIQPPEIAWDGVLSGLDGVYPAASEGPVGAENVRIALWASLSFLAPNGVSAEDQAAVELRLRQALEVESEQDVRGHIYSAIGTLTGESFLPVLESIVLNAGAATADRTEALIAMTAISQRVQKPASLSALLPTLLADAQVQIRRQAIESLSLLAQPEATTLLMQRLALETEVFLQKRILTGLTSKPSAEILEPLLTFRPAEAIHAEYGRALVAQIGNDLAAFNRAFAFFDAQADSNFQLDLAFRVARSFPADGLADTDKQGVSRKHAIAVSEYLLRFGVEDGYSVSAAEDAVGRLQDWILAEPQNGTWHYYLVELQLARNQVAEALQLMAPLLALADYPLSSKWELGLYALRRAAALEMFAEGGQLLVLLEAAGQMPPELRAYAGQESNHFQFRELQPEPEEEEAPAPEVPVGEAPAEGAAEGAPVEPGSATEAGAGTEETGDGAETPKKATSPPEM
jgi:hypothetical protein